MKSGELIISLATQGGVNLDEAQTKAISEIATDLPEGIATQIQGSLFTKESALANPDIVGKIKADSLDPVDQKMSELAKTLGLDEGFIHNLKEVKGTYNRIDKVGTAVLNAHKVALEKAKEGAPAGDQDALQKEINDLNTSIAGMKETHVAKSEYDTLIEKHNGTLSEHAVAMLGMKANTLFNGQNWAMDVSPDVNVTTAKTLFNAELQTKNVKLVDDNGSLKLQTNEGTPYYVDNKEVTPQDFANTLLAGHKLLKVTQTTPTGTPPGQATTVAAPGVDPNVMAALQKAQGAMDSVAEARERATV